MVQVTFRNPLTNETLLSELDEQMTVRDVVDNLLQHQIVPPARTGEHYILQIKGGAEISDDNATLASGGVANGNIINVAIAQRGGANGH
jgi:uncharacterized ubiquitin-like protein YukD